MSKKLFFFFAIYLLNTTSVFAGLFFQNSTNYSTDTDNSTHKLNYSTLHNITFIGADIGSSGKWVLGQNVHYFSRSESDGVNTTATPITMLELGPRFQYFFDQARTVYFMAAYNIYAKGTRKISNQDQKVDGSSYDVALGVNLKVSRVTYFGVSMNYHSLSLSQKLVGTTETDISDTYSQVYPTLDFSFRFR